MTNTVVAFYSVYLNAVHYRYTANVMKSESESGHGSANPSRQKGVDFCYIAIGLGGMCFLIGIFMAIFGNDAIAWTGVGMALYGSWLSTAFYIAMNSAGKLHGWKRFFVTPWLERSINDNLLSYTHKPIAI